MLKSTANRSLSSGTYFYKVSIFLIIAFFGPFLILLKEYFSTSLLLPFLHMLRNTVLHFHFPWAHIQYFNTSSTWAFSFNQQHLKWPGGVLHNAKHRDNRPEWFRHTIQLAKASSVTNLEPRHNINTEACPTKVLAGKKVLHAISQEVSQVEN